MHTILFDGWLCVFKEDKYWLPNGGFQLTWSAINQILKRSLGGLLTYTKMQVGKYFSPISDQVWRIVHHLHDLFNLSIGEHVHKSNKIITCTSELIKHLLSIFFYWNNWLLSVGHPRLGHCVLLSFNVELFWVIFPNIRSHVWYKLKNKIKDLTNKQSVHMNN